MKKIIKIGILALIILLMLLFSVPYLFKDSISERIKQEFDKRIAAKVEVGGIDLSLLKSFPDLNISLMDINVKGVDGFAGEDLFSIKKFSIDFDLFSVFRDKLNVNSILMQQPELRAKVIKGAKANWEIFKEAKKSTFEKPGQVPLEKKEESKAGVNLNLREFKIENGIVDYDDEELDLFTGLKDINFQLSGNMAGQSTNLNFQLNAGEVTFKHKGIPYISKAKLDFQAQIEADLLNSKYKLKENKIQINEVGLVFDGSVEMPGNDIDMDMKFESKRTEFKDLLSMVPSIYKEDFKDLKAAGLFSLNGFIRGKYSDTSIPSFALKLQVDNGKFQYAQLPETAENINVVLNIKNENGVTDNTLIDLDRFHVEFAKNPFDFNLHVKTPVSDPCFQGGVKGSIDLGKIKNLLPLENTAISGLINTDVSWNGKMSMIQNQEYENFQVQGILNIGNFIYKSPEFPQGLNIGKCEMAFTPKALLIKEVDAKTGNSDFKIKGSIENYIGYFMQQKLLKGEMNLNSDLIDLNELLKEETGSVKSGAEGQAKEITGDISIPEIPDNIDFEVSSSVQKALYENLEIKDITGKLVLRDGAVELKDMKMNMIDGTVVMKGKFTSKKDTLPLVDFALELNEFNIPKFFNSFTTVQKLAPIGEKSTGFLSMKIDVQSRLNKNLEPELNTINGSGNLSINNMVVNNSDIFLKIGQALKSDKYRTLQFRNFDFSFGIKDGNITIEPFETAIGKNLLRISGSQGLDQTLNYLLSFKIPRQEFGEQANQVLNNLVSTLSKKGVQMSLSDMIPVDISIRGTLTDPKLELKLREQASEAFTGLKDQITDKLKQEALKNATAEAELKAKEIIDAANRMAEKIKLESKAISDKIRSEADKQAATLIKNAGSNPLAKLAAEKSAEKIKKEAYLKADRIEKDADKKAQDGINNAKLEAQKVISDAATSSQ